MRKYFTGIIAIIFALALSAFTKPYANYVFKLTCDPCSSGCNVGDPGNWSTCGFFYGDCTPVTPDMACAITLNTTRSSYFHTVGSCIILNSFSYANSQIPKQDYLEITVGTGLGSCKIIVSIQAKHFNTTTQQYENASLGADLSFTNGSKYDY
jgi:hypothetical protein